MIPLLHRLWRTLWAALLCFSALGIWAGHAAAQTTPPLLIGDINTDTAGSYPHYLTPVGDVIYYAADDGVHGIEPWRVDPATGVAEMVADIAPGFLHSHPQHLTTFGDYMLFFAENRTIDTDAEHLWRADASGVQQLYPGELHITNYYSDRDIPISCPLPSVGDVAVFTAQDPADDHGWELWRSDGTPAGTYLLQDLIPGPLSSEPYGFIPLGDALLHFARTQEAGDALWRSDGTASGTLMLRTLGDPRGYLFELVAVVDDRLLFTADEDSGRTLWASDGTAAGTQRLADLGPRIVTASSGEMEAAEVFGLNRPIECPPLSGVTTGSRAYFLHGQELWMSDGTPTGTRSLGATGLDGRYGRAMFAATVAGVDYIQIYDEVPYDYTDQVVAATDGTPQGTRWLSFLNPLWLTARNGSLLSAGQIDGVSGIWRSDGTRTGTTLIAELPPTLGMEPVVHRTVLMEAEQIVFEILDRTTETWQLWRTDGTANGTLQVGTIVQDDDYHLDLEDKYGSDYRGLDLLRLPSGALVYPGHNPPHGPELYQTDPAVTTSILLADSSAGNTVDAAPHDFTAWQDRIYFLAADPVNGLGLWQTDHDGNRLTLIKALAPEGMAGEMSATDDFLYFFVEEDPGSYDLETRGQWLWRSDGTAAGTLPLTRFPFRTFVDWTINWPYDGATAAAGDRTFYFVGGKYEACTLWQSSGTPETTVPLVLDHCPNTMLWRDGQLYYGLYGDGVYALAEGASEPVRLYLRSEDYEADSPIYFEDGVLYLFRKTAEDGQPILRLMSWRPGDSEPTVLLEDLPTEMVTFGATVYVATETALWRTDGTPARASEVVSLPGIQDLHVVGDRLYFLSVANSTQFTLWSTDGTNAGTQQLVDQDAWQLQGFSPNLHLQRVGEELFVWRRNSLYSPDPIEHRQKNCDLLHVDKESGAVTLTAPFIDRKRYAYNDNHEFRCGPRQKPNTFLDEVDQVALGQRIFLAQSDNAHGEEAWVLGPDTQPAGAFTVLPHVEGEGTLQIAPDLPAYEHGMTVILTATPADGWRFAGWTGDVPASIEPASSTAVTNEDATLTLTLDTGKSVTAQFIEQPLRPDEPRPLPPNEIFLPLVTTQ